jgi:hypothetical protein
LRDIKTAIGIQAYPKFGMISHGDEAVYGNLYKALKTDLEGAAYQVGKPAYLAQKTENAYYTAGIDRVGKYFDNITGQKDPQVLFDSLMSGGKKGAEELRTTMKSLTPDQRDIVASAMIEKMGGVQASRRGNSAEFSAETFLTQWNSLQDGAKRALFAGTSNPAMLNDLNKIADAAAVMRATKDVMPNQSGTGPAVTATSMAGGLLAFPASTIALAGGTSLASYLLTSPKFVKWLSQGVTLPDAQSVQSHLTRLGALADKSQDKDFKAAVHEYVNGVQPGVEAQQRKGKIIIQGPARISPPEASGPFRANQ